MDPAPEPPRDCPLCPRLAGWRAELRAAHPQWHNAPVPAWGDAGGWLAIVGLAPGLKGANRTGRPFTGDHAGDLLFATLVAHGLARGQYDAQPGDGLRLVGCFITNAVRCVPPANKPTPDEIRTCQRFLQARLTAQPAVEVLLALGRIAHDAALRALGARPAAFRFAHGAVHTLPSGHVLVDSFHPSRYNQNTGRLTPAMFDAAVRACLKARQRAGSSERQAPQRSSASRR